MREGGRSQPNLKASVAGRGPMFNVRYRPCRDDSLSEPTDATPREGMCG